MEDNTNDASKQEEVDAVAEINMVNSAASFLARWAANMNAGEMTLKLTDVPAADKKHPDKKGSIGNWVVIVREMDASDISSDYDEDVGEEE